MKKLYRELFYIPKDGKVTEKVMMARMVCTIVVFVTCLAGMSIPAYAYFSASTTSSSTSLQSANFIADVRINITDHNGESVPVTQNTDGTQSADLLAGKTYHILLVENANSTAKTGFCILSAAGSKKIYHTQQLGADTTAKSGRTEMVSFELTVTENTTISILSHWGTSCHYAAFAENANGGELYITNANIGDQKIVISIAPDANADNGDSTEITQPTLPAETTAPTTEPTAKPTIVPSDVPTTTPTDAPETEPTEITYVVQSNETLWEISGKFGIGAADLKAYNGLTSNIIVTGDILKIPPADYKAPEDPIASATTPPAVEPTTTPSATQTAPFETTVSDQTAVTEVIAPTNEAPTEQTEVSAVHAPASSKITSATVAPPEAANTIQ